MISVTSNKDILNKFWLPHFQYIFSQILIKFKYFSQNMSQVSNLNLIFTATRRFWYLKKSLKQFKTFLKIMCLTFIFSVNPKLAYIVILTGSHISSIHIICQKDAKYLINISVKQYMPYLSSIFQYFGFLFSTAYDYFSNMSSVD